VDPSRRRFCEASALTCTSGSRHLRILRRIELRGDADSVHDQDDVR